MKINPRPCLSLLFLYGILPVSETPSAGLRLPDIISQASASTLQASTVKVVQIPTATAMVSIGSMMFSSMKTISLPLVE